MGRIHQKGVGVAQTWPGWLRSGIHYLTLHVLVLNTLCTHTEQVPTQYHTVPQHHILVYLPLELQILVWY